MFFEFQLDLSKKRLLLRLGLLRLLQLLRLAVGDLAEEQCERRKRVWCRGEQLERPATLVIRLHADIAQALLGHDFWAVVFCHFKLDYGGKESVGKKRKMGRFQHRRTARQ